MLPLICVAVLIRPDSAYILMVPQRIQTCTSTRPPVKSSVSEFPDKVSLVQSKHIWLYVSSCGVLGLVLLSLAVRTQLISGSYAEARAKTSDGKTAVNNSHFHARINIYPMKEKERARKKKQHVDVIQIHVHRVSPGT